MSDAILKAIMNDPNVAQGFKDGLAINRQNQTEAKVAWNFPGRSDTEKAAAEFLRSPALHNVKIEDEWFDREQIIAKLMEWAGYPKQGPAPEYRAMLDSGDTGDL